MQTYRTNPPSRMIPPRPALLPSSGYLRRTQGASVLLDRLERQANELNLAPSRIGRMIANDPALLKDLREGRTLGKRVMGKIEVFLSYREGASS